MQLDLDRSGGNLVRAFAGGRILIGSESFAQPLIVTAERIIADWRPGPPDRLTIADLEPALELQPEVILLGTGSRQVFPPVSIITAVLHRGVGLEIMGTAAACRTFNVLLCEYRRVAAALFVE